ncbi:hypothetical protein PAXINDRAFT_182510 [Paxillus involutus ATCC 200175]|uniref:Uncharacterized protein n=1 Tax=Paxillus involutus ATCC 200175 TaxID=664439 RepID=A0A0C9TIZ8_PAXIN|nr:hypothetical protein PAXINDRAFT_182510 [Paxillus involutus ATCC 200175]
MCARRWNKYSGVGTFSQLLVYLVQIRRRPSPRAPWFIAGRDSALGCPQLDLSCQPTKPETRPTVLVREAYLEAYHANSAPPHPGSIRDRCFFGDFQNCVTDIITAIGSTYLDTARRIDCARPTVQESPAAEGDSNGSMVMVMREAALASTCGIFRSEQGLRESPTPQSLTHAAPLYLAHNYTLLDLNTWNGAWMTQVHTCSARQSRPDERACNHWLTNDQKGRIGWNVMRASAKHGARSERENAATLRRKLEMGQMRLTYCAVRTSTDRTEHSQSVGLLSKVNRVRGRAAPLYVPNRALTFLHWQGNMTGMDDMDTCKTEWACACCFKMVGGSKDLEKQRCPDPCKRTIPRRSGRQPDMGASQTCSCQYLVVASAGVTGLAELGCASGFIDN